MARRRFISGAKCPKCGAEDKTFVVSNETETFRGCNACDFKEKLEDAPPGDDPGVNAIKILE